MFLAFLPTVPVGAILSPVSLRLVFKKYMYLTSEFLRNFFFFFLNTIIVERFCKKRFGMLTLEKTCQSNS